MVGLPLLEAIQVLLPDSKAHVWEDIKESYQAAFFESRQNGSLQEPLYPGVKECLNSLEQEGWLLGVATGKSRRGLLATLDYHGLNSRFVVLKTADLSPGKPNPDMLLEAIVETGVEASATAMIGDTTFDMEMARNACVKAIGVSWGYHEPEELLATGAGVIVDDYAQLQPALNSVVVLK